MGSIGPNYAVVDPTPLFSSRVQKWEPGAIRSLLPLEALPGMISLVAGKPSPETFPIAEIAISLKGAPAGKDRIVVDGEELNQALQYGLPRGHAGLIQWFETLQKRVHGLDEEGGWACCIGNGSQELIHRVMQVFTDPGDPVLLETPAYPGVVGFLRADGQELIPVYSDAHGLNPASLDQILSTWPSDSPRPKVLYTTPTGSNPTGQSCTETRKAEILRLAKRFNFIILEDDAYYYLNYGDEKCRARSYLALERDVNGDSGRVVRFDSLSKIVSPGMRLGILTAPVSVVDKVARITENINLQPSSTTQLIAFSLLRHWGHPGFLAHCAGAAEVYRRRRDVFVAAAERHLQGRATWVAPTAGMFVWLELKLPPGEDSFERLRKQGMKDGVLAIPGVAFMPGGEKTCYIRVSFSLVSEGHMDEACFGLWGLANTLFSYSYGFCL
ncbi:pyridoxal phosphate-dependent transferase [Aspergillus falconensis]